MIPYVKTENEKAKYNYLNMLTANKFGNLLHGEILSEELLKNYDMYEELIENGRPKP